MLERGQVVVPELALGVPREQGTGSKLGAGLGMGGERVGVVGPDPGAGRGLDVRLRPGPGVKSFK